MPETIATPEPEWLAPSLFPDEAPAASVPASSAPPADTVPAGSPSGDDTVPAGSASGNEATVPEASPSGSTVPAPTPLHRRIATVFIIIGVVLFNIIFIVPLCILGIMGICKHPFLGYFLFRDYLRSK